MRKEINEITNYIKLILLCLLKFIIIDIKIFIFNSKKLIVTLKENNYFSSQ